MAGWAVHYPVKLVSDPKIGQRSIAEMKMFSHVLHRVIIADYHGLLPIYFQVKSESDDLSIRL